MADYEQIRDTVLGYLEEDARLSWADCAAEEGSDLDRAYQQLAAAREKIDRVSDGLIVVYGVGASLVAPADVLLYADITRWEIQLRFRQGMANWNTARKDLPQREKYKRGYFAEWRWADRVKEKLLPKMDYYLDMTTR